jgi:uncharacterized membrane protein
MAKPSTPRLSIIQHALDRSGHATPDYDDDPRGHRHFLFFVVQIGIISYAFDKIGIPSEALFSLLLLSWIGSWVNIPLARFPAEDSVMEEVVVRVFGQRYVMPQWSQPRQTVLAINVGGALVPTLLSL